MSADNWEICEVCAAKDPFINRYDEKEQTWREDYTLGIDELGNFYVNYKGRCTECGTAFEFQHCTPAITLRPALARREGE